MKLSYEYRADDLWIDVTDKQSVETQHIGKNTLIRLDETGEVVSIQIMNAKRLGIDPANIMIEILPPDTAPQTPDPAEIERMKQEILEARARRVKKQTDSA